MVTLTIDAIDYSPLVLLPSGNETQAACVATAVPELDFIEIGATPPGGTRMRLDVAFGSNITEGTTLLANFTPTLADNGTVYDCIAGNDVGNASNSSTVVVQGQQFIMHQHHLLCVHYPITPVFTTPLHLPHYRCAWYDQPHPDHL